MVYKQSLEGFSSKFFTDNVAEPGTGQTLMVLSLFHPFCQRKLF